MAVNSTSGTLFRVSRFAIVQAGQRLRCYAGEFLMAVPNPDQPVTSSAAEPHFSNQLATRLDPQAKKSRANTSGMEILLQALAQHVDADENRRHGADHPTGAIVSGQPEQQRKDRGARQRTDLSE